MFFLDSIGFFSLISLIIQAGIAWVFAAFFTSLSPQSSAAVRHWRAAFLALGVGLTAVAIRFLMAHRHIADVDLVAEGAPLARAAYAVYFAGKCAFLWFLAQGFAQLRGRGWPNLRRAALPLLLVAAGVGASLPTIETVLLAQVPICVLGLGYAAWSSHALSRPTPGAGTRVAGHVALAWACAWCLYGIAAVMVGATRAPLGSGWHVILQLSSVIDLALQIALASGLIVLVMQAAQATTLDALRERDSLREQVLRDEKLRALSTLVSGVAHEINNPLTAILGFAPDLTSDDQVQRNTAAHIVSEQAERCRGIVQRLALLGSQKPPARAVLDLGELVSRVARGFGPQLADAQLDLDVDLGPADCLVLADVTALEQVLANLLANAIQASPRGERIRVALRTDGTACDLTVEDRGPGIPAADRPRVFEPFWTTKAPGVGTGLGLAVAHALIVANRGTVSVDDRPGGGARFVVRLPLCAELESSRATAPLEAPRVHDECGLRVLVVDDERIVRQTVIRHAKTHGWTTTEAESGESALRLLLDAGEHFDAVLCDLRMPGMSGVGLHDRLVERAPDLLRRVLFVTGDLASEEAVAFAARSRAPIVTKPLAFAQVFARLRQLSQTA